LRRYFGTKKLQCQNVTREKLCEQCEALSYKKIARKMWMEVILAQYYVLSVFVEHLNFRMIKGFFSFSIYRNARFWLSGLGLKILFYIFFQQFTLQHALN